MSKIVSLNKIRDCYMDLRFDAQDGSVREPDCGICLNVETIMEKTYGMSPWDWDNFHDIMCEGFRTWSNFSGADTYPIPASKADADHYDTYRAVAHGAELRGRYGNAHAFAYYQARQRGDQWTGYYLEQRLSLIDHILTLIDKMIEEAQCTQK